MKKFDQLRSVAAVLLEADIDTDIIFPARFLLLLNKHGLGQHLFNERRYASNGAPRPDFVLNTPPFDKAEILIAGPRFGTGSSREQAVWALADFGIRCVIAPSFGEIFFANCFKNGVLPIRLDGDLHADLVAAAGSRVPITVDLEAQRLSWTGDSAAFEIEPFRRQALLQGLDEIDLILERDSEAIAAFEQRWSIEAPWLSLGDRLCRMLEANQGQESTK